MPKIQNANEDHINSGESKINNEEEFAAVQTVLRDVVTLVTTTTSNDKSESHTSASEVILLEEYDDDSSSTGSDASDKTEVTNNKSVSGTFVVGGSSRSSPEKRLSTTSSSKSHTILRPPQRPSQSEEIMEGSFSGLSIHMNDGSQQKQQQPPLKPRQPEPTGSSCGALPFKGNPSKQRRIEKEKKREQRRLVKKQQQQQNGVVLPSNGASAMNSHHHHHQDDQEFDLRSKPGFINVVVEDEETGLLLGEEEDRSQGTNPSRKTAKSTGGTTHTSTTSTSSFILTKERVRSHMKDYYEDYDTIFRFGKTSLDCWEAFFRQYFTDDVMWVRSTGNPLNREGLAKLLAEDIVGVSMSIVSIDSIQLLAGGLAAVVVFTADQEYVYKGKQESDRTVITSVLHVVNGCEILIGHEHRCVGKPIPKDTRWES